jgi:hypothetical protein
VDFTSPTNASGKATWSDATILAMTGSGLGWDGNPQHSRDVWIQTKPLALGFWWRAPYDASVRVAISPQVGGAAYARYSPDLKHWSSWQALQASSAQSLEEKKSPGTFYESYVAVPGRERDDFDRLLSEYRRLDVPWRSDEDAAVHWILSRDPDYFAKNIPFIGYVEVLFEGSLHGGQRIRSLSLGVPFSMSGWSLLPRDETVVTYQDLSKWRFSAIDPLKAATNGAANGNQPSRSETSGTSTTTGSRR